MYESKVFVTMVLILIFAEVLGLYGYAVTPILVYASAHLEGSPCRLIVALIMNTKATGLKC